MRGREILLVFLVLGGLQALDATSTLCKDVKKKGYKVDCPAWNSANCATCPWEEIEECNGKCGGGYETHTRSRTCTYFDEELDRKNQLCSEHQDMKVKCDMNCGNNGKYDKKLDVCECDPHFEGTCCETRILACTNPVLKQGEIDRSNLTVGQSNRCDSRLRKNWYRFDSVVGNLMPTQCVPSGHCNTVVPFWLNGTHPKPEDGIVKRIACGTEGDDCCRHKLEIQVRNCTDYMAYYLVPTQGCTKAYCIGSYTKCPAGESSDNGYEPGCTKQFPNVKVTPQVGYVLQNEEIFLTCSATHNEAGKYQWKATWYFDGVEGATQEQDNPKFLLKSTFWAKKMGTKAQCTMQAKLKTGIGAWSIDKTMSKEYYLGIIIEEKVVRVKEGDTAYVTLRPNLPVYCKGKAHMSNTSCNLIMIISMDPTPTGPKCPGKQPEIAQIIYQADMETHCGYKDIHHKNWQSQHKLRLKPKVDIQLDGVQTRTMRLRVMEKHTNIPEIWLGYHLPTVQIAISDSDDTRTCRMTADPHIVTFDNRAYNFQGDGSGRDNRQAFVAYKHVKEPEEIQAKFYHCGGRIYCICGVAVRAGASTIVFDKCRTSPTLRAELNYNIAKPVNNTMLRIFKLNSGTNYHVYLPSGTRLKVISRPYTYDIWIEIKASVDTKGKLVGLCGNYNLNPRDDLQNSLQEVVCQSAGECNDVSFRRSWLVPDNENIFNGRIPPHKPEEQLDEIYCDCISEPDHHGYEECDYYKRYEPCDDGDELFAPRRGYSQPDFPWLKNVIAPQHQNPAYARTIASMEVQYYSSGLTQTWTMEAAREYCHKALFSSQAIISCLNEVPNQNYTVIVENCALDLVLSGSMDFISTHLDAIKSECGQELRMNLELWEPRKDESGSDGEDGEVEEIVAGPPLRLMENLCPDECNNNGACVDGKCFCKKGFGSFDCSMKVDEIPVVNGVTSSPVPCDRSVQDCSAIALEGLKYLEGPKLTCHYYKAENDEKFFYSGPSTVPAVSTLPGIFYSLWVVQCSVPEQLSTPVSARTTFYQLQVSISNDGEKQTDRVYYASYDGKCEQCVDKKCTRKDNTCLISSRCFGFAELNPSNPNQACNPKIDSSGWSPVSTLTTPTVPPTTTPTVPPTTTTRKPTTTIEDPDIVCNLPPDKVSVHRDPKDCGKYYVCQGKIKHHMPCPMGLAFHAEKERCLDRKDVPGCE